MNVIVGKLILLMRRCELLLEMGQKVLTTQEAEREPLRQDNNALTLRTLKWIEIIPCLQYQCPSSSWISEMFSYHIIYIMLIFSMMHV